MVYEYETLEHAQIGRGRYRNFRGEKGEYNKAGNRTFSVFLPDDVADYLIGIGWYVKKKPPYREDGDPINQFDVEVSFDTKGGKFPPPSIKLVSSDGTETYLNEENVSVLDTVDIEDAKVTVRPYNWDVNGKTGCKAYLAELEIISKPPRRALNASMRREEEDDG